MQLTAADWLVVALYFAFNLAIGFYYKSRAGKNVNEFFLSGRNVPWWLAGTSMVATTFAADTPLAVTGMVAVGGIAGNWLWWNFVASGMLTVFFYARLWRRSGVMTDIEFTEIRYSGKPAAFLRGFRALYLGIPINCIILGWVNLAMVKILELVLGVTKLEALGIVMGMIALTSFISTLSGLWGVLVTDLFQFVIKMGMVTVLAVFAVRAVGGIDSMKIQAGRRGSRARRGARLGAQLRSRSALRLDADDHVPGLHLDELVVHLVSRRGTRRRRLHRAAHVQRERRKEFAARDACGSISRTTPCARGRGFWWRWHRSSYIPGSPIRKPATSA